MSPLAAIQRTFENCGDVDQEHCGKDYSIASSAMDRIASRCLAPRPCLQKDSKQPHASCHNRKQSKLLRAHESLDGKHTQTGSKVGRHKKTGRQMLICIKARDLASLKIASV
jgi:hypothetical protein